MNTSRKHDYEHESLDRIKDLWYTSNEKVEKDDELPNIEKKLFKKLLQEPDEPSDSSKAAVTHITDDTSTLDNRDKTINKPIISKVFKKSQPFTSHKLSSTKDLTSNTAETNNVISAKLTYKKRRLKPLSKFLLHK